MIMNKTSMVAIIGKKCGKPYHAFNGLKVKPENQLCPHCEGEKNE